MKQVKGDESNEDDSEEDESQNENIQRNQKSVIKENKNKDEVIE